MNLVRGSVIAAIAWSSAGITYLACDLAGRCSEHLVWLMQLGPSLSVAAVSAACAVWIGLRKLPRIRSKWWLVPALLAFIVMFMAALIVPLFAHMSLGTPVYACYWKGMHVARCVGRDWSFLQGRSEYLAFEGAIDEGTCRSFQAGILPEPRESKKSDGWIRCPDDDPTVWAPAKCQSVALDGMTNCFTCGGTSDTSDRYVHSVGFSTKCDLGKVRFGVNIPLELVEKCASNSADERCR